MQLRRFHQQARDEPLPLTPAERWLTAQTIVLILFSSWAYGGVVPWAKDAVFVLAMLALPIVLWREGRFRLTGLGAMWPVLGWLCFLAIAIANPSHEQAANGAWVPRSAWLRWLPTTVDVGRTIADGKVWLAALVQGAALWTVLRNERGARAIFGVAAMNGLALAALGAFFLFSGHNPLPGMMNGSGSPFASFYYKNHWAAYGALAATAGLVLALRSVPAALAGDPRARGRLLLFGGGALLVLTTLPLPGSRSGLLLGAALLLGSAAACFRLLRRTNGAWRRQRAGLIVLSIAALGLIAVGIDSYAPEARKDFARTVKELRQPEIADIRFTATGDIWRMATQRPVYGWGVGTFEVVFPIFHGPYMRDANGRITARLQFAHNDWLQLLAESGLIGSLLLLVPAGAVAVRVWRSGSESARQVAAGCMMVAAYAWIDFPFHNPAVLMLWVVLLATASRIGPNCTALAR